ncbi:MAG: RNA ligase (ATP) [Methanogenium sp.]|jgi:RNA ligase (TIGR02306 family)
MEKVATIETISEIRPHTNADLLELATVCGFQTVVKKGEFKAGDPCIYVKSDSILKEHPEFEFLRNKNFRIRMNVKFRGEISNGIAFPIDLLSKFLPSTISLPTEFSLGTDVSEIIGASHYEKPIASHLVGLIKGNFPSYIPKTDEIRLQSCKGVLEELKGKDVYITLKCDGTSSTFVNKNREIDICSRKLSVKPEDETSVYNQIAKKYDIVNKLQALGNYGIQGEICGGKIQNNPMGLKEPKLFVFNVWYVDRQEYMDYYDMVSLCENLELETVPLIKIVQNFNMSFEELVELSKGIYPGTNNSIEGIVIRPIVETYSNVLHGRLSVKIINPNYKDTE